MHLELKGFLPILSCRVPASLVEVPAMHSANLSPVLVAGTLILKRVSDTGTQPTDTGNALLLQVGGDVLLALAHQVQREHPRPFSLDLLWQVIGHPHIPLHIQTYIHARQAQSHDHVYEE